MQQGYLPLQEQITNTSEQDFSPREEHTPQEGYKSMHIIIFVSLMTLFTYKQILLLLIIHLFNSSPVFLILRLLLSYSNKL